MKPRRPALPGPPRAIADELLRWYAAKRRDLPWRGATDPYVIWVSEIMLQQTQAAVVGPYFARFLARFPNVASLAQAPLTDVLGAWAGLGYYARARSMHRAAQGLAARGFPRTLDALLELPGFGPYTAAAVGSIAFGLREPAIDGNAVRVYARLSGLSAPRAKAEPLLRALARPLVELRSPGEVNQAIMDLGQRVCTVHNPRCAACPWQSRCVARAEGTIAAIPLKTKAKPRRRLRVRAAVARRGAALLFARRHERGLFGGLWELPSAEVASAPRLAAALAAELGVACRVGRELASVERVLTHRALTLTAHAVELAGPPRLGAHAAGQYQELRWMRAGDLGALGLSRATRQLLEALDVRWLC